MKRWVKIVVFGTVSGVGYCEHVKVHAEKCGVEGTVQHDQPGSVLIHAVGTSDALDNFIDYVYQGSPQSLVNEVAIQIAPPGRDYRGVFRVVGED